jgi:quinol monooxygenase YgiN
MTRCCALLELRQYTTFPGKRDALISLFDREFVEAQEATGMQIVAQFRDVNDPNRFVWIRGFADMTARQRALTEFYSGPVWKAHRSAANSTMYDSDNVLLLHPALDGAGFDLAGLQRAPQSAAAGPGSDAFVVMTTYHFPRAVPAEFAAWFDAELRPRFAQAGAAVLAALVSDHSENTYPQLPVRAGENTFVWIARFDSRAAYDRHLEQLAADARWSGELFAALHKQLRGFPETLMLTPTARSLVGSRVVSAPPSTR